MTRNLKIFTVLSLAWSVLFFSVLHWALFSPDERGGWIIAAAVTYGLGFALMGLLLGMNDKARNTRLNLGLWYAFLASLASSIVGGIWILFFRPDEWESLLIMLAISSVIFGIQFAATHKSIKGIARKELFK